MLDKQALWQLAQDTMQAMGPFYQDSMRKAIEESGVQEQWFGLNLARGSHPQPFTVERFSEMAPYTRRDRYAGILDTLVEAGCMSTEDHESYTLTDKGKEIVEGIFKAPQKDMDAIETLPAQEMAQLNKLLYRIVDATLKAPEPKAKWAIAYSRWTDPGEKASAAVKTDQYLTDLARYRDDAHIGAWLPYGVDGATWEAFSFVWRGDASTPEELVEKLPYREFSTDDYAKALDDLVNKGWIEKVEDGFQATAKGQELRQNAEQETDRLFFEPWDILNETELEMLQSLLENFKAKLVEMAPKEE